MKIITFIEQSVGRVSANVWLFLIVVANVFIKTFHIASESLYGDESYSIFYGQQTIKELIPVFLKDQNPPLHISLLHFWMEQFGVSDVSAKMFSVLCSVLASLVLFLFAKKFIDKTTAVFVSLLFLSRLQSRISWLIPLIAIMLVFNYFIPLIKKRINKEEFDF